MYRAHHALVNARQTSPSPEVQEELLQDAGKVTAEIAKAHAESEFEKYRIVQDRLFESAFDRVVAETKRLGEGAAKATSRKGNKR